MKFEPGDEFEQELRQAFERRPAPPGMKRKLMERRLTDGRRASQMQHSFVTWQRLAASVALLAVLAGGAEWRKREERRKEEAAREQVLTALRITSRALNQMNTRLAAHGRATQD
jgi:hypothetical protein